MAAKKHPSLQNNIIGKIHFQADWGRGAPIMISFPEKENCLKKKNSEINHSCFSLEQEVFGVRIIK